MARLAFLRIRRCQRVLDALEVVEEELVRPRQPVLPTALIPRPHGVPSQDPRLQQLEEALHLELDH
eukprot:2239303-Alexandrium_andersonii.AAC.1